VSTSLGKRLRAWAALAAFVGSLGLPLVSASHFSADDDLACGQVSLYAARTTLQYQTVKPAAPGTHCALCHWQRAVGGAVASAPVAAFSTPAPDQVRPFATLSFSGAEAIRRQPSRAPPASTLS
jgi:hypothetical protein